MSKRTKDNAVLSIEWLKQYEGFEKFSDQQALEALETIRSFAYLFMNVYKRKNKKDHATFLQNGTLSNLRKGKTQGE
ncbi:MAG: hypothetical protein DI538_07045 [Azospira oryzae]|jgi:hypothetical protein|nr:MAG: hypothetical protein DI538_07045 [Azospira oryzae]